MLPHDLDSPLLQLANMLCCMGSFGSKPVTIRAERLTVDAIATLPVRRSQAHVETHGMVTTHSSCEHIFAFVQPSGLQHARSAPPSRRIYHARSTACAGSGAGGVGFEGGRNGASARDRSDLGLSGGLLGGALGAMCQEGGVKEDWG